MRTFASIGAAAIAASLFAAGSALAWTAEQPAQQDSSSVMYSDPDSFKALQDKVNGKSQSQSGFFISGGVNGGDAGTNPYYNTNPYRLQPMTGSGSAFSYTPPNATPCLRGCQ